MAGLEPEDELNSAAIAALPTPAGTPYRTPSRTSRKSQRSITPPVISLPPSVLPTDKFEKRSSKRASKEYAIDENMSILDPRRFTPTLHANLVSEILTLRRDQEDKLKIIENLESSLYAAHEERDALQVNLSETAKESRSLKRQLAIVEGGTTSALGELTREREEAAETTAEAKRRLETAQKKVRAQEEDSQRIHDLWAKEKDSWQEERRRFERKLHVAETRLKAVLEDFGNLQAAQSNAHQGTENEVEDNDSGSVRTQSITNSIRFSTISALAAGNANGISLADELNFDDDDDYQTDPDGRQSVLSNPGHYRNMSRDSILSATRPRNYSIDSQVRPGSVARGRLYMNPSVLGRLEGKIQEDEEVPGDTQTPSYTDTGVQYSPPPSPKVAPAKPVTPEPHVRGDGPFDIESPPRGEVEIEANQRRKRVHINRLNAIDTPKIITHSMVSSGSQTVEPLSPPITPLSPAEGLLCELTSKTTETKTKSIATQTENAPARKQVAPLLIPSISIVPPSCPPTPREPRLPQHVKDVGCQVSIIQPSRTTSQSIAVQTDEIRVDKRLDRLPRHLHPSTITSRPSSPIPDADTEGIAFTPVPGHLPARNPRRLANKHSFMADANKSPPTAPSPVGSDIYDTYPGNNDNGPLSTDKAPMRRPPRISSLFAGFDVVSSDEADEFGGGDDSDTEYRTALSAPNQTISSNLHGKRTSASEGSMSPDNVRIMSREPRSVMRQNGGPEIYNSFSLADARDIPVRKPSSRPPSVGMSTSSRASVMRKAAMIQNGIHSYQVRPASPSLPDIQEPPFPIPTRASSRQPAFTASAPSDGSRSPSRWGSGRNRRGPKTNVYRNNSIRKIRSAAALPRIGRHRRRGSSPPPRSPSQIAPESPQLPPLPNNDITTPRNRDRDGSIARYKAHRSQPSTNTANTENSNAVSAGSSQQISGVVEAIAQTMVGEWMFKYVRRRKSFGVADSAGREENSNDRHKRWVWLAPYERAILWSSKQPVSGIALMGKSGRKLTIQSVLDVKDDNPIPKGESQIFNRSILILTPQRALKFTAITAERHYLWLMSLSFLAHSQQAVPEITPSLAPPRAAPAPDPELSKPKPKRVGIRDSIRLTKGKNPSFMTRHNQNTRPAVQEEVEPVPMFPVHIDTEALGSIPAHQREPSVDAAEPPMIPRFHGRAQGRVHERTNQAALHGRRRSNTGGHVPPPLSFRGFSPPASSVHASSNSTAGASVNTAGSSDMYGQSQLSSNMTWGISTVGSQRTSEASSIPTGNFFEAIGTVRMEAFISPIASGYDDDTIESRESRYRARRQSKERRRRRSRSRHRDSYTSRGTRHTRGTGSYGSKTALEEDYFRDDPFRGF
ncbi:putative nuclear migration protein [Rosellinia necatrix]|uniref:Putative nuclear migration protein n=1 Tax=Rosellinia necatrix TaxID=77044 RepID=A0A1S7UNN8_ROSNE|nr:putative nuclear migration protein [Rosellinia necatrix]